MKKVVYILFLLLPILLCQTTYTAFAQIDDVFEKNAFRVVRKTDENGQIILSYIFPVNSDFMQKNCAENEFENFKLYLTLYINALAKKNKENELGGVSVTGCSYYTDIDGIGFSILFNSSDTQRKYFGGERDDNNQNSRTKTTGFLIRKTQITTIFPISTAKVAGDLKMVCILAISSWSKENDISETKKNAVLENLAQAKFIYDFATKQSGVKSQKMYFENGFYHNVFIKSVEEIEKNNTISFYTTTINKGLIYVFLVLIVCLGVGISYFVVKRKTKKKKL